MIIIVLYINFETYFHVRIVKGALYYSLQFCANDDIPPRQCAAFHCSRENFISTRVFHNGRMDRPDCSKSIFCLDLTSSSARLPSASPHLRVLR